MAENAPKIILIENNPADRAVISCYLDKMDLRYSENGVAFSKLDKFLLDRIPGDWAHDRVMFLFDLGLSPESEITMQHLASSESFRDQHVRNVLSKIPRYGSYEEYWRLLDEQFGRELRSVEGLEGIAEVRYREPRMLCGIISHFAQADIRPMLKEFCLWGLGDRRPQVEIVYDKRDLRDLEENIVKSWTAWQDMIPELYAGPIVLRTICQRFSAKQPNDQPVVPLKDFWRRENTTLVFPPPSSAPVIIFDSIHLTTAIQDSRVTLQRLISNDFQGLAEKENVQMLTDNDLGELDPNRSSVVFSPEMSSYEELEKWLTKFADRIRHGIPRYCFCFVPVSLPEGSDSALIKVLIKPPFKWEYVFDLLNFQQSRERDHLTAVKETGVVQEVWALTEAELRSTIAADATNEASAAIEEIWEGDVMGIDIKTYDELIRFFKGDPLSSPSAGESWWKRMTKPFRSS